MLDEYLRLRALMPKKTPETFEEFNEMAARANLGDFAAAASRTTDVNPPDYSRALGVDPSYGLPLNPDGSLKTTLLIAPDITRAGAAKALPRNKRGVIAYHASPHDFDKFDFKKSAYTGEGSQAFAKGGYFAQNPRVSGKIGSYREYFENEYAPHGAVDFAKDALDHFGGDKKLAVRYLHDLKMETAKKLAPGHYFQGKDAGLKRQAALKQNDDLEKAIQLLRDDAPLQKAWTYKVRLKAEPDAMLDWDAPLNQQSPQVQKAINKVLKGTNPPESIRSGTAPGRDAYLWAEMKLGPEKTNKLFTKQGVPATKYFDEGSRAEGRGSRNYVAFDDKIVEILRKYGIAPPAAMIGLGEYLESRKPNL